jgi:hypothetical protein
MSILKINKLSVFATVAALITSISAVALDRIPVHFIVAANSHSGVEAQASSSDLDKGIDQLNTYFNELGLEFYRDDIVYITNDDVDGINNPSWNTDNEEQVKPWFSYGKMNIIVASLDGLSGHAYWNYEQRDVIEIEPGRLNTSTIAHEVGHTLSLKHTYQSWDAATIEVMEGPNGYKYGDSVIDTPVDPGDRASFDHCVWKGNQTDSEGATYHPDGFNIMGKGHNSCRNRFSSEQKKRMDRVIQTFKFHLFDKYGENQNPSCSNSQKVAQYPHHESFDYEATVGNQPWVQDVFHDDEFNWKIDVKTSSSSTGASSAQAGHSFVHIDAGHEFLSSGSKVNLLSPCYTLNNQNMAELDFYYNMRGADIGKLSLEVTTDNGDNWLELWSKTGQQHTSGENWSKANVNLDKYLQKSIQLRLKGEVIGGSKGDISIDSITLKTGIIDEKPVITGQQNLTVNEDQSLTLSITDLIYAEDVNIDNLVISSGENYQVDGQKIIPKINFNGTLTVAVSARNNGTDSEPFNVTIIVNPVNDQPTAIDDSSTVVQDSVNNIIDVISNDTDIEGDSLMLTEVNYAGSGNVMISENKLVYTPASGFSGTEGLSYLVDDNNDGIASGNLTLTVTAITEKSNSDSADKSSGGSFSYLLLLLLTCIGRLFTKVK